MWPSLRLLVFMSLFVIHAQSVDAGKGEDATLVDGYIRGAQASDSDPYVCFTGEDVQSSWAYARTDGSGGAVTWQARGIPSNVKDSVTFVIPCGLGGKGGTIFGAPIDISIEGKRVTTITTSVKESMHWQDGDCLASFHPLHRDKWNDPFGLLLVTLPSNELPKDRAINFEARPNIKLTDHDNAFFMLNEVPKVMEVIERVGGIKNVLAGVPVSLTTDREHRNDDSLCLTGNAVGELASKNHKLAGRYTYYEGRTDSYHLPHLSHHRPRTRLDNYDENMQAGGWIAFDEGKLTDADQATRTVSYPHLLQTIRGTDIVFDLTDEFLIDGLELHAADSYVRNIEIWLKSPGETQWTMVHSISDRAQLTRGYDPKLVRTQRLPVNSSARWVRINARYEAAEGGFREIQIWGRPLTGQRPAKKPYLQSGGDMPITSPRAIVGEELPTPVCPLPQQIDRLEGQFDIATDVRLILPTAASERTSRTADVLRRDLADEFSLNAAVEKADDSKLSGVITFLPIGPIKGVGAHGYELTINEDQIQLQGVDEQGEFYATQTLMQLIRQTKTGCHIPSQHIRDWPDKSWRLISGVLKVTEPLLRTLARFKVTHYNIGSGRVWDALDPTVKQAAEDRFIQAIPFVQFNWAYQSDPEAHTERLPGESLADLNPGRRNPCPSHPGVWKYFFSRIDKAARYPSDFININMDEMYQDHHGSRWNVCSRCRARNLTGHELMAQTIEKIDQYIESKGKKTLMIASTFSRVGISYEGDTQNDWRKAADLLAANGLNKRITLYNWHGTKLADRLHGLGFPVLLWSTGISNHPLHDTYEGFYVTQDDAPFNPPAILAMTQHIWSPQKALGGSELGAQVVAHAMPTFDRLYRGVDPPSLRGNADFYSIDLSSTANQTRKDDVPFDGIGWADFGPNYDLRAMQPGEQILGGVPFNILPDDGSPSCVMVQNRHYFNRSLPTRVSIPVGKKAAGISFLHTLDARAGQSYSRKQELVGYYFMVYEDGSYQPFELK